MCSHMGSAFFTLNFYLVLINTFDLPFRYIHFTDQNEN